MHQQTNMQVNKNTNLQTYQCTTLTHVRKHLRPKSNFIAQIPIIFQAPNVNMSQKDMEAAMIDIVTKNVFKLL